METTEFCAQCQETTIFTPAFLHEHITHATEFDHHLPFVKCLLNAIQFNHPECQRLLNQNVQVLSPEQIDLIRYFALKHGCLPVVYFFDWFSHFEFLLFCDTRGFREAHGLHHNDTFILKHMIHNCQMRGHYDYLLDICSQYKMYDCFLDLIYSGHLENNKPLIKLICRLLHLQTVESIEMMVDSCFEMQTFLFTKLSPLLETFVFARSKETYDILQQYKASLEERKAYTNIECKVLPTDVVKTIIQKYI